jgi:predicted dehydrogenase
MVGGDAAHLQPQRGRAVSALIQAWPPASRPRPIVLIGAGAIARTAHLPAYQRLGYPVAGVYDVDVARAHAMAADFGIPVVFASLDTAAGTANAVFDLAVPGDRVLGVLALLPEGSAVLIQKPMGSDLDEARRILDCCTRRRLVAAVNFQLRFSPGMLALHDLVSSGALGTLVDVDVRIVIDQPWQVWTFLERAPRLEVVYHSIHYLDAIRWIAGEPRGAYCRVVRHPATPRLRDTRSSIVLDYGDAVRCSLVLNHTHRAGTRHRASEMMVEGLDGAARLTWGVNLEYPAGPPDTMEISHGGTWSAVALRGSWFPHAFEGPMSNLQRFVAGEDAALISPVQDAIKTMAVVEACYASSAQGGTPIPGVTASD